MSLADDVRGAVALAKSIFTDLEITIAYRAWIGQDGNGKPTYAPTLTLRAISDARVRQIKTTTGDVQLIKVSLLFLAPIPATTSNAPYKRVNPVDPQDIFIMPDGTTGPVVMGG